MIRIKKGQVSIFIILGLIMLLTVVLFIFFKSSFKFSPADNLPREVAPIKVYVEECMNQGLGQALLILGEQGGYITIPQSIAIGPSQFVSPDGLGLIKIPFWFYQGRKIVPSVPHVQQDIADFVKTYTENCIDDFKAFEGQFKIEVLGDMDVQANLNQKDVSVNVDYPLRVYTRINKTHTLIEKFTTSKNVRMKRYLEIAESILDSEINSVFLENFTIDLMATNPDIPFTDMEFTCNQKTWNINDIKATVDDMLFYNLPRVRFKNTDYLPFQEKESKYEKLLDYHMDDIANGNYPKDVPADAYEYTHMFWDPGLEEDKNIKITIRNIPGVIDLVGRPNDNGILKSKFAEGNSKYIRFLCVNIYHFLYDINYPVVISIRDEESDGFFFNFALPVTIHNNEPYKLRYGTELFEVEYFDRSFCEAVSGEPVDIRAVGNEAGYSNMELKNVNISMSCIKYFCPLGLTTADKGAYRLVTQLPSNCENPFIIAQKDGYLKARKQLANENSITIPMTKLKNMDFEVVYNSYNSFSTGSNTLSSGKDLEDDMQASIQISTGDFYQYKVYPNNETQEDVKTLQLVEGDAKYHIEIVLTLNDEYIGGFNGDVTLNGLDVANADKIVFHAIKYVPTPFTEEEKLDMMQYILEGDYRSQLRPELI